MKTRRVRQKHRKNKRKKTCGAKRWTENYENKHRGELGLRTEQEQKSDIDQARAMGDVEIDETNTQRKEQANHALWEKVDTKIIIIGAHRRKWKKP